MKCKLLRPMDSPHDPEKSPNVTIPDGASVDKRGTVDKIIGIDGKEAVTEKMATWVYPEGTEIEHMQAYKLVRMGVALPLDDECVAAAHVSPQRFRSAKGAYERLDRGISPEDFAKYDRDEIEGYNPDGSYVPGPAVIPPEWPPIETKEEWYVTADYWDDQGDKSKAEVCRNVANHMQAEPDEGGETE